MKQRLFGVAMALCVIMALILPGAFAADSGVYAILYADGELTFQNGSAPKSAKAVSKTYPVDLTANYTHISQVPWLATWQSIRVVTFADSISPRSTAYWFYGCANLQRIDNIENLDTSHVTTMFTMFYNCSGLTTLDLSSFDTSHVTDMSQMFCECYALTTLNLSGFDTSLVTTMRAMFNQCLALTALDLSSFDTSHVTDTSSMFSQCSGLTTLDLSSFDTSHVTTMRQMFSKCSNLTALDVSGFDTASVTDISSMFSGCSSLTAVDLSGFDTSNVTDTSSMFSECSSLTALDVSGFDTSHVTTMRAMFYECSGLKALDVSGFDTANVTDMYAMFYGCSGLTALDLSSFDTANVASIAFMFSDCPALKTIFASVKFTTASVTDLWSMFDGCASLVGGKGTKYDGEHVDKTYARIDGGASAPGYFTAKDAPSSFTVTFNPNGGSVSPDSKSVTNRRTYGELPTPIRTGYAFDGWFDATDGGTQVTASTTVNLSANQELYARWTPFRNTVTFDANGGSVSPSGKEVTNGGVYGALPTPDRPGYVFDGWYTAIDGGTQVTAVNAVMLSGAQTLYAHWRRDAVTYSMANANGETSAVTDISQVAPGSELVVEITETPSDDFRTASVFCAVYDRSGMMIRLQVWEMDVSDPLNIAMSGRIRIPENVSVGEIRVFVLSENLVPLRAAGILG